MFRAVGKPGDRTPLHLEVTTINTPSGSSPNIRKFEGSIVIEQDSPVGDCDGDGVLTAADALNMDLDRDGRVTSNDARLILDIRTGKQKR